MQSLATTNEDIKTSIWLLEDAKMKVWNRVGYYSYQMMEDPTNADEFAEMIKINTMSASLIDIMIELARSGLDILSGVNNKSVTIANILSER